MKTPLYDREEAETSAPGSGYASSQPDRWRQTISDSSSRQRDLKAQFQDLLNITQDSVTGFQHAAQHVFDRGLRDEFQKFARERRSMLSELMALAQQLGRPTPSPEGSTKATLHRAWMNIRNLLDDHDDQSILEEAERGEEFAAAAYREALASDEITSSPITPTLQALREKVERAHQRMLNLRDSGLYDRRVPRR